jgi:hypothetical protein
MTLEEYQKFLDMQKQLTAAFREYASVIGIENEDEYTVYGEADQKGVEFYRYDYRMGERHIRTLPTRFLFDRVAWQAEHDAEQVRQAKLCAETAKSVATAKEKREREQLAELLKKYGKE